MKICKYVVFRRRGTGAEHSRGVLRIFWYSSPSMRRLRDIAVWVLLATIVGGGVLGPSLHQFHHAQERWATAACHAPAVHHSDVPLWTAAGGHVDALECDLCATRLLVVPPSFEAPSPSHLGDPAQVTLRTHLTPAPVAADRLIRGPPARDEARPA